MPEVTAVAERRRPGIATHRSSTLTAGDRRRQLGVPVTSPERTLRDLRPRLTERELTRMVNDARRARQIDAATQHELLGYRAGPTRSEFEDAFQRVCRHSRLPAPRTLAIVCGFEVDAVFDAERLIVELDGWAFHNDRTAFESDRERDAQLLAAGYATVRITWERLTRAPEREAARLAGILRARAHRSR